jgi:anti-sigma-K factor RskA
VVTHPTDELAAYSIGALEEAESASVTAHLRTCESCRTEVEAYERTAWRLAEAVAAEPPGSMRAAVVERARAERPVRRMPARATVAGLFRWPIPAFVPLALAFALVVSLAGYAGARRDADRFAAAVAGVAAGRVVALLPSADLAQARGVLVQPASGAPYLILDLPAAPSGKTWEAWVIRGEQPIAAGLSDGTGVAILTLTVPLRAGDVVAVTLERAGGAGQPTSNPVLTGKSG